VEFFHDAPLAVVVTERLVDEVLVDVVQAEAAEGGLECLRSVSRRLFGCRRSRSRCSTAEAGEGAEADMQSLEGGEVMSAVSGIAVGVIAAAFLV
jgi:hypothetical protein